MATDNASLNHSPAPSATNISLPLPLSNGSALPHTSSHVSLTQTLDKIHNTASRTDTLTSFDLDNPLTRPPSGGDIRTYAGDFQTGLTGLYSRFRASVAGPSSLNLANDGSDDVSARSIGKPTLASPIASAASSRLQSPLAATFNDTIPYPYAHSQKSSTTEIQPATAALSNVSLRSPISAVEAEARRGPSRNHSTSSKVQLSEAHESDVDEDSLISPKNMTGFGESTRPSRSTPRTLPTETQRLVTSVSSQRRSTKEPSRPTKEPTRQTREPVEPLPTFTFPPTEPQRPPLLQVSQSHLPGYTASQATSLSGDYSSTPSASKSNGRKELSDIVEAPSRLATNLDYNETARLKNKVLAKELWMRDETAKECFSCGEPFSTFRRKHHCRICGNIFDSKCTNLIDGKAFGQSGRLRICKPCEAVVNGNDDDSSDYSEDEHRLSQSMEALANNDDFDPTANFETPSLTIPVARKSAQKRGSAVIEFANEHTLSRPSSSRSLKSHGGFGGRNLGHRKNNSRIVHQSLRSHTHRNLDDRAPFQKDPEGVGKKSTTTKTKDTIIDPELEPFMSDDNMSEDESTSIFATLNGEAQSPGKDHDRLGLEAFMGSNRRKPWQSDRTSIASRDADNSSILGRSITNKGRRRNLSTSSYQNPRPSPKRTKSNSLLRGLAVPFSASPPSKSSPFSPITTDFKSKMIRSSAMRGADAPAVELNQASMQHVKNLLKQMIDDANVTNPKRWEKALLRILLQSTVNVNPDIQGSHDDIDIRQYIKLKKILGGSPGDTAYVSGVVFTKNLALKSMPRSIPHPRILIIAFPIEYARHYATFMSLDPVINQEREYLSNMVRQIAALNPSVLLVETTVSGIALEFLESAGIAVVHNVKPSVLNAIARCTETVILTSRDQLSMNPNHLGTCASFDVKTYPFEGARKSIIYFTGCRKDLGCTIVLRGADWSQLRKLKRITEFMCYVVYNLKLETCIMRDEGVLIPTNTLGGTFATSKEGSIDAPSSEPSSTTNSQSLIKSESDNSQQATISDMSPDALSRQTTLAVSAGGSSTTRVSNDSYRYNESPNSVTPSFYNDLVEEYKTKIVSASPFVKFMQPYLLSQAREQETKLIELQKLRDQYAYDPEKSHGKDDDSKSSFVLVQPAMVHKPVKRPNKQIRDFLFAVHDAEYETAKHAYMTQKRQWEAYLQNNPSLFDPFNHQNIAVLYSMVNSKSNPCEGPVTVALEYYVQHDLSGDFLPDISMGEYVRKLCESGDTKCDSPDCNDTMYQHHRQYVHGDGRVTVSLQQYPARIRGMYRTILMWSVCRICSKETLVTPMSENTERYSFGKYLELTFWSTGFVPKGQDCPHDIHRNHVRFLQYNNVAIRIRYDQIQLYEIMVPRTTVTWNVDKDLRLKNELYNKFKNDLDRFMKSVRLRIDSIKEEVILTEKIDSCKIEIQRLRELCTEDQERLTKTLQQRYMNSRWYEIIALNKAARAIQENSIQWDERFADFEKNFFPSEKDIRRITALQIKRIFEKVTTFDDGPEEEPQSPTKQNEKSLVPPDDPSLARRISTMSPEDTNDVLASVIQEEQTQQKAETPPELKIVELSSDILPLQSPSAAETQEREDVKHLDLAVSPQSEAIPTPQGVVDRYAESLISPKTLDPKMLQLAPEIVQTVDEMRANAGISLDGAVEASQVESKIPRPKDTLRRPGLGLSPALNRAHSQPHGILLKPLPLPAPTEVPERPQLPPHQSKSERLKHLFTEPARALERRLGSRSFTKNQPSLIPRSIPGKRHSVYSLAKHYEQLSREFEKQRIRERQLRESRAFPLATSKPVVEVYRNEREAAEETESLEDIPEDPIPEPQKHKDSISEQTPSEAPADETKPTKDADKKDDTDAQSVNSQISTLDETNLSDTEDDSEESLVPVDEAEASQIEELAKQEKSSILKLLTNFWGERSSSGWEPLDYPFTDTEHFWGDSDIIVREDEPSSIIALALSSSDYLVKMRSFRGEPENPTPEDVEASIQRNLGHEKNTNIRYAFQNRGVKAQCKIFYAESFDAVRRHTGAAERFVESLSRCKKWISKGGKTKSLFLKTLDDRFVLKSLSPIEVNSFFNFAPSYFSFVNAVLYEGLPSVIAKMFGLFQVTIRSPSGLEFNWFMLCMENLFYDRVIPPGRMFDLKGSMRNRKIQSTGESDEVLLDENLVDIIFEKPIFVREHTLKLLTTSVHNDTLFLSKQNVMDYSLMAGFVDSDSEIVVGIIDCIRTYTLDKKLETWFKDRGSQRPTITSPKDYRNRFRVAMGKYILLAPNCWHQFSSVNIQGRAVNLGGSGRMEIEDNVVD